jgi:hypothetical protein
MKIVIICLYGLGALALVVLFGLSRREGSTVPRPAVLLDRVLAGRVGRLVVLAAWWWLGWHLFAR